MAPNHCAYPRGGMGGAHASRSVHGVELGWPLHSGLCTAGLCLWTCVGCHLPATAGWAEALSQHVIGRWRPVYVQRQLGVRGLLLLYASWGRHGGHVPPGSVCGAGTDHLLGSAPCCL